MKVRRYGTSFQGKKKVGWADHIPVMAMKERGEKTPPCSLPSS
jgi:hypothetical protein